MATVYSVGHGVISEYELLKTTACFYFINYHGHKDRLSRDGLSLPQRFGGRTTVTTDVLEAYTAAQKQINIIHVHIGEEQDALDLAERKLAAFVLTHTGEEDDEKLTS